MWLATVRAGISRRLAHWERLVAALCVLDERIGASRANRFEKSWPRPIDGFLLSIEIDPNASERFKPKQLLEAVAGSEDFDAFGGDGDGVFDVDAGEAVDGFDGPVVFASADSFGTLVDHGFDGDDEAFIEPEIVLHPVAGDVVRHLRLFVHGTADAVADELLDDAVALGMDELLHPQGDLRPFALPAHFGDRELEGVFGDVPEALDFGRHLADADGDGGIAAPAVQVAAGVDADEVAFL